MFSLTGTYGFLPRDVYPFLVSSRTPVRPMDRITQDAHSIQAGNVGGIHWEVTKMGLPHFSI